MRNLEPGWGLNAATGEYEDLIKAGIIDPAKVTRSALQNAASIAALFLTTEAVIADKPEKAVGRPRRRHARRRHGLLSPPGSEPSTAQRTTHDRRGADPEPRVRPSRHVRPLLRTWPSEWSLRAPETARRRPSARHSGGMAILVDPATWPGRGRLWCHLVSDTSFDELHAFAHGCGIPERAFERDHYDVPAERRAELIAAGASRYAAASWSRRITAAGLRRPKHRPPPPVADGGAAQAGSVAPGPPERGVRRRRRRPARRACRAR